MESGDPSIFDSVKTILLDRNFRHVRPLGKGAFGDVFSAVTPTKDRIAVKLIKNENSWPFEERIWPIMKHSNVLELIDVIDVVDMNLKLYIMPRHRFVLERMVSSTNFLADRNGLQRVKRWLSDVLNGLQYMHKIGYAHLDMKSDNVLISIEDRAIICDFSGISPVGVHLKRLCAPREYCPPEWYDPRQTKEGIACDVWLYGLMTLQVLTGHWPCRKMRSMTDVRSWKKNVEPVIVEALKKELFFDIMKDAFPSVPISNDEILTAHDYVSFIMKWDPTKRPSLQEIMEHPFLQGKERSVSMPDLESKGDEIKTDMSKPCLEGGINTLTKNKKLHPCGTKGENSVKFKLGDSKILISYPLIHDSDEQMDIKNNPFVCSTNYQEFLNYMKIENQKGKTLIKSPFMDGWIIVTPESKTSSVQEPKMEEECNYELAASERPNENFDRNLQRRNMDDIHMSKNDATSKKPKLGGKIKQWISKKWTKMFHRKRNFIKLSEESE